MPKLEPYSGLSYGNSVAPGYYVRQKKLDPIQDFMFQDSVAVIFALVVSYYFGGEMYLLFIVFNDLDLFCCLFFKDDTCNQLFPLSVQPCVV